LFDSSADTLLLRREHSIACLELDERDVRNRARVEAAEDDEI
jgi:hypothetical protein